MSEKRRKIMWTAEEEATLARLMFERWVEKPLDFTTKIYEWVMIHKWPTERVREIPGLSSIPKVERMYTALVNEFIKNGKEFRSVPEQDLPSDLTLEQIQAAMSQVRLEVPQAIDPTVFLQQQPTEVLVQEIEARKDERAARTLALLEKLAERVFNLGEQTKPVIQAPTARPVAAPVIVPTERRKPRIALMGMMSAQMTQISQRVGEKADLVLISNDTDKGVPALPQPHKVDFIIVNTKFVRHHDYWRIKEEFGHKVEFIYGGVTAFTQKILDLTSRQ